MRLSPLAQIAATLLAATALALIGASAANAGQAQTVTVTNLNDSGDGSLRQALADVDAGGTVNFDPSLKGTIDLQTALEVDKNLTLTGPGADKVTIDANNRDNILVIGSNTPGNYVVEVEGLTFFRGAARNPDAVSPTTWRGGGGIAFASGNSLTVRDSVFRQNLSSGQESGNLGGGGGGIAVEGCTGSNDGATLTIESTLFVRNGANPEAGAVAMRSKRALTITDTEFRNNVGEGQDGGGAVLVEPRYTNADPACVEYASFDLPSTAAVTITDSLFEGNGGQADDEGPAISLQPGAGPKTIDGTEFRTNGGDGKSGAIYDDSASPMFVEDSLFRSNYIEESGGAIFSDANYGGPAFTDMLLLDIDNSAFIGNSAENYGGAIYYDVDRFGDPVFPGPELGLRITNSEFIGNSSHSEGGAIFHSSGGSAGTRPLLHVSDSLFEENSAYGSGGGSVIDWDASNGNESLGEIEILDTVVDSNTGGEGGTPINLDGAAANTVISNVSVTNNVAGDNEEAGILLSNAGITPTDCTDPALIRSQYDLSNVTVAGNAVAEAREGAIRLEECGSLDLDSSTIALNAIAGPNDDSGQGSAGLRVDSNSVATVRNTIIAMNSYSSNTTPSNQSDCYLAPGGQLTFEDENLVGSLTGCGAATGTPLTGNPGFAELDPVEVQNIQTGDDTFIVPLAANSQARGGALGDWADTDQRGANRPGTAADLGAVQYYESYTLTVQKAGAEGGEVVSDRGDIDCGEICEDTYPDGETVTLRPLVSPGVAFTGWSGACTGSAVTCEVTVDEARTVTANFGESGGGNGTVKVVPAAKGVIKVSRNRTFAVARVTCEVGTCQVSRVSGLSLGIRGKRFKARAIFPKSAFTAGQTRKVKVQIPKRAYKRLLRNRKSGTVRLASFSVANDSAGQVRMKVYRNFEFKLRRK